MTVNGTDVSQGGENVQHKSPVKLNVIVVGAGISGLATAISTALSGHNVTVFESAKELLEVCFDGAKKKLSRSRMRPGETYFTSNIRSVLAFK